jgi:hypothetical protein
MTEDSMRGRPLSPDRRWWWDGERWLPVSPTPSRPPVRISIASRKDPEPEAVQAPATEAMQTPVTAARAARFEELKMVAPAPEMPTQATPAVAAATESARSAGSDVPSPPPAVPRAPAPAPLSDRPSWIAEGAVMPWSASPHTRPATPVIPPWAPQAFEPTDDLHAQAPRRSPWPLAIGGLAILALLLLVVAVVALLWQRVIA